MSWSKQGIYKNAEAAEKAIEEDQYLPGAIKEYIITGIRGITNKDAPVSIDGSGHLCYTGPGGGNYELTSAKLEVKPLIVVG